MGSDRSGVRFVDGGEGGDVSPGGEDHRGSGHGVNVMQMVFGNTGETSGTGVCFTRDPSSGEKVFYGDYLVNAQGEDVVAGIRTPTPLREMAKAMPKVYGQLDKVRVKLENHYRDMQDMEFTVEEGTLYMLQTRTGKRTPAAAFRIAVDMANEKLISKEDAIQRIKSEDIERLFYPVIDAKVDKKSLASRILATGINAVPGAAVGKVVFSAQKAEEWAEKGEKVILVRRETSPEDVGGMAVAQGILTATGGKTSHAAVVARGLGQVLHRGRGEIADRLQNVVDGGGRQDGERRGLGHAGRQRGRGVLERNAAGGAGTAASVRDADEVGR